MDNMTKLSKLFLITENGYDKDLKTFPDNKESI